MPTQGEQILKQLRRYEDGKRVSSVDDPPAVHDADAGEANEDELLNSQIELMQLAASPGTMVRHRGRPEPAHAARRHYASLKILASEPRYFPPLNFGVVESDLYRCGHPQVINFPFLESLKLRTIIYVGDKTNNWDYYRWIQRQPQPVGFVHVPLDLVSATDASATATATAAQLNYLLAVVAHSHNYPILIHSNKGKHRVGVVVALIRKLLQGWVLAAVYDEYGKYAKHGKDNSELQFIEFFRSRVPVPPMSDASVPRFIDLQAAT